MPIKQPSWIKIHRQNGYERVSGRRYKFATSRAIHAIHFLSLLICLRPRLVFTWPIIKVSTEPCSTFAQRFLSHWQVAWILLRHLVWYSHDIFSLCLSFVNILVRFLNRSYSCILREVLTGRIMCVLAMGNQIQFVRLIRSHAPTNAWFGRSIARKPSASDVKAVYPPCTGRHP